MLKRYGLSLKIWVGFGAVLTIMLVLGVVAVVSMVRVSSTANELASGYVPEVSVANEVERNMLMANWHFRAWALTAEEEEYKSGIASLELAEKALEKARVLAEKQPFLRKLESSIVPATEAAKNYRSKIEETVKLLAEQDKSRDRMNVSASSLFEDAYAFMHDQEKALETELSSADRARLRIRQIKLMNDVIDIVNGLRVANFKGQALRDFSGLTTEIKKADGMGELLRELFSLTTIEANRRHLQEVDKHSKEYVAAVKEFMVLADKVAEAGKQRIVAAERFQKVAEEISSAGIQNTSVKADSSANMLSIATWTLVIGLLAALVGAVVLCAVIIRAINAPIVEVTKLLQESGREVAAASTQLSTASQKLSASSTESAASLEETASSIEEFTTMVTQNSEHAREVNSLAVTARDTAEKGETEIKGLITAMDEIVAGSRKIEEISSVIDGIAFQTNLLALNAAVEAARAGEHGKGFAVVAEAVRNLAQKSAASAKEISTIIADSVSKSDNGARIASQAGDTLKNIVVNSKKVSDLIAEIASATSEQTQGMAQISKAIAQIDQATQSNAATAEESAAASEELSAQATTLQEAVERLIVVVEGSHGTDL